MVGHTKWGEKRDKRDKDKAKALVKRPPMAEAIKNIVLWPGQRCARLPYRCSRSADFPAGYDGCRVREGRIMWLLA